MLTPNSLKVKEQASERGASSWLTVLPLKDLEYDLNKGEFKDALKLRYNWEFSDIPNRCVCGDIFDVDHAMTRRNGGFVTQRHNEIRDLEAALLSTVCKDVEIEPPLQQITGEFLNNGTNTSRDARLDILARGFCERQKSAYFDDQVFHPYADSFREKTSEQVFKQHENEKKRNLLEPGPILGPEVPGDSFIGWTETFSNGFGNLDGEFWLGLNKKYRLTQSPSKLGIDLEKFDGSTDYPEYIMVAVADERTAGDSLKQHGSSSFTTKDQDNDSYGGNCADRYKGGWWYHRCYNSNLNGVYRPGKDSPYAGGVSWNIWNSFKRAQMKNQISGALKDIC
ncbi:Techylectin-5B [Stylophora pistillata]|uniref:Techylectin-5B n=1 Tax=Stylophora pistillata TaxID=50429 RepID=A0A2B4R6V8_STYPI|nr:Techylectin-5B [Stylophora pistillata]